MSEDIREINPCEECPRQRFSLGEGTNFENAGAYLLFSALEMIDNATIPDDVEQGTADFLRQRVPSGAQGAIGFCGRQIGRGACRDWKIEEGTIVKIEQIPSVVDERGFTPDYDLDPEDVFERSSYYDE
jgi:hypothetical protein